MCEIWPRFRHRSTSLIFEQLSFQNEARYSYQSFGVNAPMIQLGYLQIWWSSVHPLPPLRSRVWNATPSKTSRPRERLFSLFPFAWWHHCFDASAVNTRHIQIAITPPRIVRFRSNFTHSFIKSQKIQCEGSRSKVKVRGSKFRVKALRSVSAVNTL